MPHQNYSPMCKNAKALIKGIAQGDERLERILLEQYEAGCRTARKSKFPKTKWRGGELVTEALHDCCTKTAR
jgi:hypothetical protein